MSDIDVRDFLAGYGGDKHPGFKFDKIGDTCKGTIVERPRVVDVKDPQGRESRKLVIAVQDDDGNVWALWVKAGAMAGAIAEALKQAGVDGLAEGGTIAMQFSGERDTGKPSKLKQFRAKYQPPASTVGVGDLF